MIIDFKLHKVLLEKKLKKEKQKIEKINIKTDISHIEEEKIELKDKKAITISFFFNIFYEPEIAKLFIEGSVLYVSSIEEIKEILESWKKKELPKNFRIKVLNYILNKCNTKALVFEEDLNLPPHIPLPKIQLKE